MKMTWFEIGKACNMRFRGMGLIQHLTEDVQLKRPRRSRRHQWKYIITWILKSEVAF
jgi:hypothetical protein